MIIVIGIVALLALMAAYAAREETSRLFEELVDLELRIEKLEKGQ